MTKALGGEASWNMRNVAVDAFGSALGNSIVKSMKAYELDKAIDEVDGALEKRYGDLTDNDILYAGVGGSSGGSSGSGSSGGGSGQGATPINPYSSPTAHLEWEAMSAIEDLYNGEGYGHLSDDQYAQLSEAAADAQAPMDQIEYELALEHYGADSAWSLRQNMQFDGLAGRNNQLTAGLNQSIQGMHQAQQQREQYRQMMGDIRDYRYAQGKGLLDRQIAKIDMENNRTTTVFNGDPNSWNARQVIGWTFGIDGEFNDAERFLMRAGTAFVKGVSGTFDGIAAVTGLRGKEAFVDSWTSIGNFVANPIDSTGAAISGAWDHFVNIYETEGGWAAAGEAFGMFLSGVPTAMLGGPALGGLGRIGGIAGNWASRGVGAAARGLDNLAQRTVGFGMKEAYLATAITINSLELDNVLSPALMTSATVLERLARTGIGCFVAGTLVHTSNGLKAIEDIRVGDMVLSQPEVTGDVEYKPVANTFIFHDKNVFDVEITTKDGRVDVQRVTDNHPYWVDGIGWTRVDFLEVGQEVELADKSLARITKLIQLEETERVYNFEVDEYHTYYVGEIGVWVHNTRECGAEVSLERANKFSGLPNNVAEPLNLIRYEMSNALRGPVSGSRQVGIDRAWALETELIMKTGRGTTPWTLEQIDLIKNGAGYRDLGFTGHHLNRVKDAPQWKADPRNIIFLRQGSGMSHMRLGHPGGTRAVQPPKLLIDREAMLGSLDGGLITAPYVGPDITHYLPLD